MSRVTAENQAARATVHIEFADGSAMDVEWHRTTDHPLTLDLELNRPPVEVPPEETNFSPWVLHWPGPKTFGSIQLGGLVSSWGRTRPSEVAR